MERLTCLIDLIFRSLCLSTHELYQAYGLYVAQNVSLPSLAVDDNTAVAVDRLSRDACAVGGSKENHTRRDL